MRTSPTTRPSSPSMGIKPIQRACPGKSASSAGTKISSQIPPSDFASGDMTRRERNHRIPNPIANTGIKNAPMPQNCSIKSAMTAPTKPIQLRAACEPVSTEALLNDGSSGEYEASARKRRSAETHNRNPISSLSRRLLVGAKIREMDFMGALDIIRHYRRRCQTTPEPDDYAKKLGGGQSVESIELASQHSTCRADALVRPIRVSCLSCRLCRVGEHQRTDNDPVNRKWRKIVPPHVSHKPCHRCVGHDK